MATPGVGGVGNKAAAGPAPVVAAGKPDRLWRYFLGGSVTSSVLVAALPSSSYLKPPLLIILALALAGAFAFGIIRRRPERSLIWWLPLAGLLANLLVALAWTGNLFAVRGLDGFGSIVETAFIASAVLLIGFLAIIVRFSEPKSRPGNRVDALIISVGLGSLWFEYLIWPYYVDGHLWSGLLPSANTLVALALTLVAVRVVLTRRIATPAKVLLLLSVLGELTAIGISNWNGGEGVAGADTVVLLAWMGSFALLATLALHPSMAALTLAAESPDEAENRPQLRVIILTLAALIPVYAELIHDLKADGHATDETVIVGAAAVLFVLVALRMNDLMVNINEHRKVLAELKLAEQARVKSLEEIAASEEQYRLLVAGSFDGILILDSEGRVIDCNPAGEVMFGFTLAGIKGRDAREVLFPPGSRRTDLSSSSVGRVEMVGMRSDGVEFPIELTLSDLRRRQDKLLCVSIRDLSDRMEAEKAKRESDAKSRFLSTMSHELRTPLNSILGFAQLAEPLVASETNDRLPTYMKNIQVSGWHLLTLINDVLDFSGVQSGQLKLNPATVVLADLVDAAAAKMDPIAHTAGVKISFDVDPTLSIEADPLRLEQVLLNLLTNAVKFTSTEVWLRAWRLRSGIAISIRDDGDGIAPEQQERVFEEFVQLQAGSTRGFDGAGLGLPISRRLVEAMGGTVQLESHPSHGATFTVWLPGVSPKVQQAS